jgi:hypothetical protein
LQDDNEKIAVVAVDKLTIKFANKASLEKIIEYINFGPSSSSSKYSFVFNRIGRMNAAIGTSSSSGAGSKSHSPAHNERSWQPQQHHQQQRRRASIVTKSLVIAEATDAGKGLNPLVKSIHPNERKSSKASLQLDGSIGYESRKSSFGAPRGEKEGGGSSLEPQDQNQTDELIEQVLSKV